ncbi:MAG: hypothetical protein AB202_00805 [Parcubacteria bacterium C7867-007]|nr:MAG: hypothetical protein AB202_00805 [Parcubacteria bacterium C7867-007]
MVTIDELLAIEKGQRVVYHTGLNLQDMGNEIRGAVGQLVAERRASPHMKRVSKSVSKGRVDLTDGVGEFEYFVVGR